MSQLTAQNLRDAFFYDEHTGFFTRKKSTGVGGRFKAGSVAGSVNKINGYVEIWVKGKSYTGHRLAFLYMEGAFPAGNVDHKNLVRSDNSWANLRKASQLENTWNMPKQRSNTSGHKGVSKRCDTKKWTARIKHDGEYLSLGCFDDIADAVDAYRIKAVALRHEFARIE